jgi:hypothetical protein
MAKIRKYEKQVNYLWYEAKITDEQLAEWKKAEHDLADIPDWAHELDYDLVKDKTGNDDYELELIEE